MATATKARTAKKVISNVSETDAQDAAASYTAAIISLQKVEAEMNEKLNKVKENYQQRITDLKEQMEEPMEVLQAFANEQKASWGKRKSFSLLHATIGFRLGNWQVVKSKKFTWDAIVELLKKNKAWKGFIRTKEEVNKEAILTVKEESLLNQLKEECYLTVGQDETFFVDPKIEEIQ